MYLLWPYYYEDLFTGGVWMHPRSDLFWYLIWYTFWATLLLGHIISVWWLGMRALQSLHIWELATPWITLRTPLLLHLVFRGLPSEYMDYGIVCLDICLAWGKYTDTYTHLRPWPFIILPYLVLLCFFWLCSLYFIASFLCFWFITCIYISVHWAL